MNKQGGGQFVNGSPLQRTARHEHDADSVHASRARQLYLAEITRQLPRDAFLELRRLAPEDAEGWARKWRIATPDIIGRARALASFGQQHPDAPDYFFEDFGDGHIGPTTSEEWAWHLARIDAFPPDPRRIDVFADVMSDAERITALSKLKSLSPEDPSRVERERYLRKELPAYRERLLDQDITLAPVAADPSQESLEQFLTRARNHWEARVLLLRRFGFTSVSTKPELTRDIEWVVRYHVLEESARKITDTSSTRVEPSAVTMAVRRTAKLIGLQLRGPRRLKAPR